MNNGCSKTVYTGSWGRGQKCSRKAVKDGFCKQHHPDTVEARRKKSQEDYEIKMSKTPYARLRVALDRIAELEGMLQTAWNMSDEEFKKALE